MGLTKCPRCELNYMNETDTMCKVCYRELHGKSNRDEIEMCTSCNESPALPGKDVCLYCLREMNKQKGEKDETDEPVEIGLNPVSGMEEIMPEVSVDEDEEFHALGDAMSLEEMSEKESMDNEELDD
ncbi:MAG: hypothetical protein QM308_09850 [Bacillota bacterium]|nr:hypothetical protein [Bacillota bacterium]